VNYYDDDGDNNGDGENNGGGTVVGCSEEGTDEAIRSFQPIAGCKFKNGVQEPIPLNKNPNFKLNLWANT